ncbi:DEAD/DEAH box helicase [Robbsia andropogonis]|uniref:DEAD/DEAH box helicase n=1 Tax=Robbsia andropogonis TaxID=28092 RepID=UPI0004671D49|nr:DEAD/DEAH box helicase [Robbsia andropogonis]MCP1116753.1 DEAD/DEAH box helicase [Robbsia andropogonis]MCP1126568.1 DEAD/DEAH box helicase [Robbsia andropogonis]
MSESGIFPVHGSGENATPSETDNTNAASASFVKAAPSTVAPPPETGTELPASPAADDVAPVISHVGDVVETVPAVVPDAVTFATFGLHPKLLQAVTEQGYTKPTPIQARAIPVVLTGSDLMGAAQTGTGKTASFSLPIIQRLMPQANNSTSPARHPVRALILTPTRELADQVADNVAAYAKHTDLRSLVVFGGIDMQGQAQALRGGVEILVATPGRLLDHVQQRNVQLGQVQMLVLDEADRMLDMGFLPDLQRILNLLPENRQTLLFSATFSNDIKKLASTYLRNPTTIEVARNATASTVRQILFEVDEADKPRAVTQLIRARDLKQVIVFCNSKLGAGRLARTLEHDGIVASAIHGDKSQSERMQALEAFKKGSLAVLVATDVAARGLDVTDLPAVINYDLPFNAEDYVHRIGRTGRAGASGDALSLCSSKDLRLLADIEKMIGRPLQRETLMLPASPARERGDRSPRDGRASSLREPRDGADAHSRREGASGHQGRGLYGDGSGRGTDRRPRRHAPIDDIFTRPYEPMVKPTDASSATASDASLDHGKRTTAKRPLAALLGGLGMPRKPD